MQKKTGINRLAMLARPAIANAPMASTEAAPRTPACRSFWLRINSDNGPMTMALQKTASMVLKPR